MQSMFSKVRSCVKTPQGLTDYFTCNDGTRQGCTCSPLFFSLFINDIVSYLRQECGHGIFVSQDTDEIIVLMYADDISNFADTVARLQKQIDTIFKFCSSVKIQINLSKTKTIVIRNGGYLKEIEHWTFNGRPIEVVSFYKYLGVYMTPKLRWSKTWGNAALQAKKAVSCILRYQKKHLVFSRLKTCLKFLIVLLNPYSAMEPMFGVINTLKKLRKLI